MISWLKKYGSSILKDIGIVLGFVPLITQATNTSSNTTVTKVTDTLTGIAGIIQTVEAAFSAAFGSAQTGAAKLQAVQPEVTTLVQQWLAADFPGTAKIGNQPLFAQGVQEISQGVVDVLNSLSNNPQTVTPVNASGSPAPAPAPLPVPTPVPVTP
jgi:cellulase/cellobiase CelA1